MNMFKNLEPDNGISHNLPWTYGQSHQLNDWWLTWMINGLAN